jgi:hypothetical protein
VGHASLRSGRRRGVAASRYDVLVDGERAARLGSEDGARAWIASYRQEHAEDDPEATHVQILERNSLAWLVGGKLVDRDRFF